MFKSPSPDTIIAKVQNIENSIEIRQLRALVNTLQFQIQQKDQQLATKDTTITNLQQTNTTLQQTNTALQQTNNNLTARANHAEALLINFGIPINTPSTNATGTRLLPFGAIPAPPISATYTGPATVSNAIATFPNNNNGN
mmetsp:Transcript_6388/g.5620  ORF Transcript_6388/g.5620 Transcript_6388/m.5620 type:complete len:141 (+) Transcript_6388:37-459(+)